MTANTLVQALVAASIGAALSQAPPREIRLADLTVPNERLPAGCALVAAPSQRLEGNRVRSGLWTGLNIGTNRGLARTLQSLRPFMSASLPVKCRTVRQCRQRR